MVVCGLVLCRLQQLVASKIRSQLQTYCQPQLLTIREQLQLTADVLPLELEQES